MISPKRHSPIETWLNAHGAQWGETDDAAIARNFGDVNGERAAASQLALCDLSTLAKLGLKGSGAAGWLAGQGVAVPSEVFAIADLAGGGLVAKHGNEEFFLEDSFADSTVKRLSKELGPGIKDVYRVERHDGTFLLSGSRANEVLLQTCGVNFREAKANRVVFTRAAGVSCCILPRVVDGTERFQVWVDPSYAFDLWHSFEEIVTELGGRVVGADAVFTAAT